LKLNQEATVDEESDDLKGRPTEEECWDAFKRCLAVIVVNIHERDLRASTGSDDGAEDE